MRLNLFLVSLGLITLSALVWGTNHAPSGIYSASSDVSTEENQLHKSQEPRKPSPTKRHSGPDWQREFFEEWYHPYGGDIPSELKDSIWADVQKLPAENPSRITFTWEEKGPAGIVDQNSAWFSGRVLDLNTVDGAAMTVASASGGLWQYSFLWPLPLTDDLPSQWIGALAIDPNDENTMIVGTGEFFVHNGMGMYKTTDGGITWHRISMYPESQTYFRIKYSNNGQTLHAATNQGYFRSTDGGESWTYEFEGIVTDLAMANPGSTVLYQTRWDEGLFKTTDDGVNWYQLNDSVIPGSELARGAVCVCASNPNVVYAAFSVLAWNGTDYFYVMEGIYKTINGGFDWIDVTPPENYMGAQGWYNNVISVCPTNADLVFAGGVNLLRSQDGGNTWEVVVDDNLHVDYHAMQWNTQGNFFWVGHDGGLSFSQAQGAPGSWSTNANHLPITQFTQFDTGGISWPIVSFAGGSQDNGICTSYDGGTTWDVLTMGDGGGIEFGNNSLDLWFANGIGSDGWSFHHYRSQDGGMSTTDITNGIEQNGTWYPAIRRDGNGRMYTYAGNRAYYREDLDTSWQTVTPDYFASDITQLTVSPVPGNRLLFICLGTSSQDQLFVYYDGIWWSRKAGLPSAANVRKVVPHPTNADKAYALMNGLSTPGEKLYMTDDLGLNWVNITGNLPNMPMADLVVHPDTDDILFLGTGGYGFFRTTDGGAHWERWNNGSPQALMVMEMKTLNLRFVGSGFHVVAATYGRSIWSRNINGDDFTAVENPVAATGLISSQKAAPNPFNATTTISFDLAREAEVKVEIFDISGRRIDTLMVEHLNAGPANVTWDGQNRSGTSVASGKYLTVITVEGQIAVQEIMLAK